MKFEEALKLARQGTKVRPIEAENEKFFYLDEEGKFIGEDGIKIVALTVEALLNDWEIFEEEDLEEKIYCMDREYDMRLNRIEERLEQIIHYVETVK